MLGRASGLQDPGPSGAQPVDGQPLEPATPRLLAALVAVGVGIWLVNRPAQQPAAPGPNPHTQSHTKKEPST